MHRKVRCPSSQILAFSRPVIDGTRAYSNTYRRRREATVSVGSVSFEKIFSITGTTVITRRFLSSLSTGSKEFSSASTKRENELKAPVDLVHRVRISLSWWPGRWVLGQPLRCTTYDDHSGWRAECGTPLHCHGPLITAGANNGRTFLSFIAFVDASHSPSPHLHPKCYLPCFRLFCPFIVVCASFSQ